ncbi:aldehyde dehydrogenase [Streptomyces akebiae]|uniref:Aldehyde dehydrogenase n=1 Tax=Streptomyces akebiae TaxID=2865673 RepID=A0ABX8XLJ5_9ACTN|nr:aldehyde dehydrogenase [Streptomyces akebiae]QYX76625.1 aldehyde dehydrogenase [Streptomyces akebiae]
MSSGLLASYETVFIDGEWLRAATRDRIQVVSPWSEEVIASVPAGSREDIDRAVGAARRAYESGPWPSMSLDDRIGILARLRDLLVAHTAEFAQLITDEMGCPITQSRAIQVSNPVGILEAYLDAAAEYPFRTIRRSKVGQALVTKNPIGVVAAVVPWNVPLSLTMQKLTPALLTGCTVVLKPAPETPLDAYLVARLLGEAGLPPGVVNVVPADREVSEYLISHPDVSKVTFTGSSAAGRRIAEICGRDLRRVTLELGGKSAAVVLDDADLDAAVSSLRLGAFRNSGQVCSLKTRLVVPESRLPEFLERLEALVDSMPVGDPHDEATHIGPLVSERQRSRVEAYIEAGKSEGARLVRGGGRPAGLDRGWFVEPTVFTGVRPDARIAQKEIFGPVVAVIPYKDEDEAIAIANDSQYGLNGSVFSSDVERGLRVAARIHTGTVELNGSPAGFRAPMGGVKHSGLGREFGPEGLDAFVETKSIGVTKEVADSLQ